MNETVGSWYLRVRKAREHAADAIEGYHPDDDMTVELAFELVEKDRRIAELEAELRTFAAAGTAFVDRIAELEAELAMEWASHALSGDDVADDIYNRCEHAGIGQSKEAT